MLTFKSMHDLDQLDPTNPAYAVGRKHCLTIVNPEDRGYLVLIQEGDTEKALDLPELKRRLVDLSWEGVIKEGGFYYAVYLTNNEFALEFLIPDADWIKGELRESLEAHAVP